MRNHRIIGSFAAASVAASGALCVGASAWANGPYTTSQFTDIPGAVFFDIDNLSSSAPLGPFLWAVGSTPVNVTSTSGSGSSPDMYGFFSYPAHWQLPRDPVTDPGNFTGYYREISSSLYTVLDFDVALTGFGASLVLERQAGTSVPPDEPDTIYAYDGPGGTGNLIASVTTVVAPAAGPKVQLDFVGVYVDGPAIIRSVILAGGTLGIDSELRITGLALSLTETAPPCASDVNGDTESDILDFLDFMDSFGTCDGQSAPCAGGSGVEADFNGDTLVDVLDFLDFLDEFGTGC